MTDFYAFAPDPARARALDRRMQQGLADSLRHIHERTAATEAFERRFLDQPVALLTDGEALPPAAFGWYYETAEALLSANIAAATAAARRLSRIGPAAEGLAVRRYGAGVDGSEGDIYARRLDDLAGERYLPAPDDLMAVFPDRLAAGFDLLDRTVPELAAEIRALIREIALAVCKEGAAWQFDGGSSYQLWGLLLLNPRFHHTPVAVAEVLAHEAAHAFLFGCTYDEPLVRNPDSDLYPSPLRRDPRPMDGIYHATYVSARMCWAMRRERQRRRRPPRTRGTSQLAGDVAALGRRRDVEK